jgi:hypothetical protein
MTELTEAEFLAAEERGRIAEETEARAISARYDRQSGRIIVELKRNCTFTVPARSLQGLVNATEDEIAEVEVLGLGYGLHWESLNEDHAVPALVAGIFGNRRYMAAFDSRIAAEAEATKGGRPRKAS